MSEADESADTGFEQWNYYRLDHQEDDKEVVLVIGESADYVWVLDPCSGEQRDIDRAEFVDGLDDGSIKPVSPTFEAADTGAVEA